MRSKMGAKDTVTLSIMNVHTMQEQVFVIEKRRRTQIIRTHKKPKGPKGPKGPRK